MSTGFFRKFSKHVFGPAMLVAMFFAFGGVAHAERTPPPTRCQEGECRQRCDTDERPVGRCNNDQSVCCVIRVPSTSDTQIEVSNPLAFNTVEGVLGQTLSSLQAIIGILSIITIVIGGILYITSAGDEGRIKTAKGAITAALVGLALGVAAPSFLRQIGEILGWSDVDPGPASGARTLAEIATSALNFLLSIVGVLAIIMLVIGGIMYLTSAGDEKRMETGKTIVKYSLIGIAIALASLVIVTQLAAFFSTG